MKILVLNCGSTSIKYQLLDMRDETVLAKGLVDKIGISGSYLKFDNANGETLRLEGEILDHKSGIEYLIGVMTHPEDGCLKTLEELYAVGHRVVHGGEAFKESVIISDKVIEKIEECVSIAPLHNPPNLKGIYAIQEMLSDTPQVAVFDTAFHHTIPPHAYMYGSPYSIYSKYGIRRYGFHGISHSYVAQRGAQAAQKELENSRIITCHLGGGASVTAIKNGKSVDTSMGFTPVEGLIMGTRSGDIDAGAILYLAQKEKLNAHSMSNLLNKHSGVLGISGLSSDMRDIEEAVQEGTNERATLAWNMFAYRVRKYIGSYMATLGGLDLLIFTGGVGENSPIMREVILSDMERMGIELDTQANAAVRGKVAKVSTNKSAIETWVIPTNEELMIARETLSKIK